MKNHPQEIKTICDHCGNSLELKSDLSPENSQCSRCGRIFLPGQLKSLRLTAVFALTALIFYAPAMIFPFMSLDLYGRRELTTIWGGVLSLVESGSHLVAGLVFLASIAIPAFKLLALLYLSTNIRRLGSPLFKTKIFRFVEYIGRWSMLDVLLLTILVALIKLGSWASVEPQKGSLFFALVVVFTMLSSASFDPRLLWRSQRKEHLE